MKDYMKQKQSEESPESKSKKQEYMKQKRTMESPKSKPKKRKYMKNYMKGKRESMSFHSSVQISESKQKKKQYMKEFMKRKRSQTEPIERKIFKFHIVSQGPLYICTCCDQLWYRHSVSSATTLKVNNPEIKKSF